MKDKILDLICAIYHCCYTGKLEVTPLDPIGYDVSMELYSDERHLHIAAELPDDEFLQFFEKELRLRHLATDHFYTGYMTDLPPAKPSADYVFPGHEHK